MADRHEKKSNDSKPDKIVVVPKNSAEVQKIHVQRLMRNFDRPVYIPEISKDKAAPLPPEFVREIMGSSAGAGSGEFHVYRGSRRREYNRLRNIEEQAKKDELNKEFQSKVESDRKEAEERTAKKRNKRLRKKQKQLDYKRRNTAATKAGNDLKIEENSNGDAENYDEVENNQGEEDSFIIGGR